MTFTSTRSRNSRRFFDNNRAGAKAPAGKGSSMEEVRRGEIVRIDGKEYRVTAVEHYGFFVQGRRYIVLYSDKYEIVRK